MEKVENPCEMTCVCLRCGAGAQHTGAPVAARLSGLFLGVGLGLFLPVYMQMQMRLCLHLHLLVYMGLYVYLYLVCVRMRSYTVVCVCICIWHGKQCLKMLTDTYGYITLAACQRVTDCSRKRAAGSLCPPYEIVFGRNLCDYGQK